MRKYLLFWIMFIGISLHAQLIVSDPATTTAVTGVNTQLGTLQGQISSDNQAIINELRELNQTLKESKELQEEMKERQKREEEALYKVPSFIKTGSPINTILDTEVKILNLIQHLRNIASNIERNNITSFIQNIMSMLNKNVSYAVNVCTDNIYRMTTEERINFLNDIEGRMLKAESDLLKKIQEYENMLSLKNKDENKKRDYDDLMSKKITPIKP